VQNTNNYKEVELYTPRELEAGTEMQGQETHKTNLQKYLGQATQIKDLETTVAASNSLETTVAASNSLEAYLNCFPNTFSQVIARLEEIYALYSTLSIRRWIIFRRCLSINDAKKIINTLRERALTNLTGASNRAILQVAKDLYAKSLQEKSFYAQASTYSSPYSYENQLVYHEKLAEAAQAATNARSDYTPNKQTRYLGRVSSDGNSQQLFCAPDARSIFDHFDLIP
jgi:hypothetical protein